MNQTSNEPAIRHVRLKDATAEDLVRHRAYLDEEFERALGAALDPPDSPFPDDGAIYDLSSTYFAKAAKLTEWTLSLMETGGRLGDLEGIADDRAIGAADNVRRIR